MTWEKSLFLSDEGRENIRLTVDQVDRPHGDDVFTSWWKHQDFKLPPKIKEKQLKIG